MTAHPAPSDNPVFLLAEHLDTILAATEDLRACKPPQALTNPQRVAPIRFSLQDFVSTLQRYEMTAIVRIERARELTRALVRKDNRFAMLGGLFVGGTAPLDEAVKRMIDKTGNAFDSGGDPVAYLRERGVVEPDIGHIADPSGLQITEDFRLAGSIELGPLSDLVATFLDTIELHYDLFPELQIDNQETGGELVG
jgi:hypothetical protein